MKAIHKYRRCFAAFFLALYSFVAIPGQVWHHHKPADSQAAAKYAAIKATCSDKQVIYAANEQSSADHCKICAHKYSPYEEGSFFQEEIRATVPVANKPHFYAKPLQTFCLNLSNKSPPAA